MSFASNLVPGDTNPTYWPDVFVRDMAAGTIERVSVSDAGEQLSNAFLSSISADGRFVVFYTTSRASLSDTNDVGDVFVRDRVAGRTELISVRVTGQDASPNDCQNPERSSISADGRFVVYESAGSDLVPGQVTGGRYQVYLRDRLLGTTELISATTDGVEGDRGSGHPIISPDGRFVAYRSQAQNLVAQNVDGFNYEHAFLFDRISRTTELVSLSTVGTIADYGSYPTSITPGGRYIAFSSYATNLHPDETTFALSVFVRDRALGTTSLASRWPDGTPNPNSCNYGSISANGRFVTMDLEVATGFRVIAIRDTWLNTTEYASVSSSDGTANATSFAPVATQSGRYIAFVSSATNLVAGDSNNKDDAFLRHHPVPPSAHPASCSTFEDVAVEFEVATDNPWDFPLAYEIVSAPSRGGLADLGGGRFRYTPNPDTNGADTFTYRVGVDPDGTGPYGTLYSNVAVGSVMVEFALEVKSVTTPGSVVATPGLMVPVTVELDHTVASDTPVALAFVGTAPYAGDLSVPATVTVPAGSDRATFDATVNVAVSTGRNNQIRATLGDSTGSAMLRLEPAPVAAIGLPADVAGGLDATGTVELPAPAGPLGQEVRFLTLKGGVVVPSGEAFAFPALVPAGATTATFRFKSTPVPLATTYTVRQVGASTSILVRLPRADRVVPGMSIAYSGARFSVTAYTEAKVATGATVFLTASSDTPEAPISNTTTYPNPRKVPAGYNYTKFEIVTQLVHSDRTVTVTVDGKSGSFLLKAPLVTSGEFSFPSRLPGQSNFGRVRIAARAPAGGVPVALSVVAGPASLASTTAVVAEGAVVSPSFRVVTPVGWTGRVTLRASFGGKSRDFYYTVAP